MHSVPLEHHCAWTGKCTTSARMSAGSKATGNADDHLFEQKLQTATDAEAATGIDSVASARGQPTHV